MAFQVFLLLLILCILPQTTASGSCETALESNRLRSLLDGMEWSDPIISAGVSAPGYTTQTAHACGIVISSNAWSSKGLSMMKLIMCHLYDWSQQEELVVSEGTFDAPTMCATGHFIDGVTFKERFYGMPGDNDLGYFRMQIRCSNPFDLTTQDTATWVDVEELWDTDGGTWGSTYTTTDGASQFISGVEIAEGNKVDCFMGICGDDDMGIASFGLQLCEIYCGESLLKIADIPDQVIKVQPPASADPALSGSRTYHQTIESFGAMSDYFQVQNSEGYCELNGCFILKDCDISQTQGYSDDVWFPTANTDSPGTLDGVKAGSEPLLQMNADPAAVYSVDVCLMCTNIKGDKFFSNTFNVKTVCSNDIEIYEPAGFSYAQTKEAVAVEANWNTFDFASFQTKTSACQVDRYYVYEHEGSEVTPTGIVSLNPYDESATSGTVNSNSYSVKLTDGERPKTYEFKIKAYLQVTDGEPEKILWSPAGTNPSNPNGNSGVLSFTIACPSAIDVYPLSLLSTTFFSFIGAEGSDAIYEFPAYASKLSKCSLVIGYALTSESDPGLLRYPSASCSADPCTKVDLDVTVVRSYTFALQIETTAPAGSSGTSPTITIQVVTSLSSPSIQASTVPDQEVKIDSNSLIYFPPFVCTTGCDIANYQATSSSSSLSPVAGITNTPTFNFQTQKMEFTLDDYSSLGTFTFYIYAQQEGVSAVHAYSNLATVTIVCGSETVNVLGSQQIILDPYAQGTFFDRETYTAFRTLLQSSHASECPLVEFSLWEDSALTTAWTDASIVLSNGPSPASAELEVNVNSAFRKTVYIKGSTSTAHNYLDITFTVCGNEVINVAPPATTAFLYQEGTSATISVANVFSVSVDSAISHALCAPLTYELRTGSGCSSTIGGLGTVFSLRQDFSGLNLDVEIAPSITATDICIRAKTIGEVVQDLVLNFEVCGSESISLVAPSPTISSVLYNFTEADDLYRFNLAAENFIFSSSRPNCPPVHFRIVCPDKTTEFTGEEFSLEGSTASELVLVVKKQMPWDSTLFIEAASENRGSKAYLELNIKVCGYEEVLISVQKSWEERKMIGAKIMSVPKNEYNVFASNDSSCPVNRFDLVYQANDPQKSELSLHGYFVAVAKTLDLSESMMTSLIYLHDTTQSVVINPNVEEEQLQPLLDKEGFVDGPITVKEDFIEVDFLIQAITRGTQKASLKFKLLLISKDAWTTMNFPPRFSKEPGTYTFALNAFEREQADKYFFIGKLPEVVDDEGDEITVSGCDLPYVELERVNPTGHYYNLIVDRLKIDVNKTTKLYCTLKLTDSQQNQAEKLIEFKVKYENGLNELGDFSFHLQVHGCNPMAKLLSYSFFCNGNGDDIQRACEIGAVPSAYVYKQESKLNLNVDLQGELEAFNEVVNFKEQNIITDVSISFSQDIIVRQMVVLEKEGLSFTMLQFIEGIRTFQMTFQGIRVVDNEIGKEGEICVGNAYPDRDSSKKSAAQENLNLYASQYGVTNFVNSNDTAVDCESGECSLEEDLKMTSVKLSYTGEISIAFNQAISVPSDDDAKEENVETTFKLLLQPAADGDPTIGTFLSAKARKEIEAQKELERLQQSETDSSEGAARRLQTKSSEQQFLFTWHLVELKERGVDLKVEFANPESISQSPYGRDQIVLEFPEDGQLVTRQSNKSMSEEDRKPLSFSVFPILNIEYVAIVKQYVQAATTATIATMATMTVVSILQNKSLQDIWSVLNSQQLTIHLMLLNVPNMPSNAFGFMSVLKDLNQRDMYPTDLIYDELFNFTKKDSFSELFENMGYESGCFIYLTGSLIINIAIIVLNSAAVLLVNSCAVKWHKKKWARKIGARLPLENFLHIFLQLVFSGYLELMICCLISTMAATPQDFDLSNSYDTFSQGLNLLVLALLVIFPLFMAYMILVNEDLLQDPEFENKYGFFYEDLKTSSAWTAGLNNVFMLRRLLFVLALVFFDKVPNMQIIAHLVFSLAYTAYLMAFSPYSSSEMNFGEKFNEVSVIFISSLYLVFLMDDSQVSLLGKIQSGWLFLAFYMVSFGFNFFKLVKKTAYDRIPVSISQARTRIQTFQFKRRQRKWLRYRRQLAETYPSSRKHNDLYAEARRITEIEIERKLKEKEAEQLEKEMAWLEHNELSLPGLNSPKSGRFSKRKKLMKKHGTSKRGILTSKMLSSSMVLPQENMLSTTFWHNDVKAVVNTKKYFPPFSEEAMGHVLAAALREHGADGVEDLSPKAKQLLYMAIANKKIERLRKYLSHEGFMQIKLEWAPVDAAFASLSLWIFGTPRKHYKVRRQLCNSILSSKIRELQSQEHPEEEETPAIQTELTYTVGEAGSKQVVQASTLSAKQKLKQRVRKIKEQAKSIREQLKPFADGHLALGDNELKYVAEFLGHSVVVLSHSNKMAFFDQEYKPPSDKDGSTPLEDYGTPAKSNSEPAASWECLYLLKDKDEVFHLLVHPSQEAYQTTGEASQPQTPASAARSLPSPSSSDPASESLPMPKPSQPAKAMAALKEYLCEVTLVPERDYIRIEDVPVAMARKSLRRGRTEITLPYDPPSKNEAGLLHLEAIPEGYVEAESDRRRKTARSTIEIKPS